MSVKCVMDDYSETGEAVHPASRLHSSLRGPHLDRSPYFPWTTTCRLTLAQRLHSQQQQLSHQLPHRPRNRSLRHRRQSRRQRQRQIQLQAGRLCLRLYTPGLAWVLHRGRVFPHGRLNGDPQTEKYHAPASRYHWCRYANGLFGSV